MNTKSLLLITISAAWLPLVGQAQPVDAARGGQGKTLPNPAQVIDRLDADGSGTISAEEAKGSLAKRFDKIDADGDGEITESELAYGREERREKVRAGGKRLKEADTDGNGAISADEAADAGLERLVENFDHIDADGDGEVSREEMRDMAKQMKKKKQPEAGIE